MRDGKNKMKRLEKKTRNWKRHRSKQNETRKIKTETEKLPSRKQIILSYVYSFLRLKSTAWFLSQTACRQSKEVLNFRRRERNSKSSLATFLPPSELPLYHLSLLINLLKRFGMK